jgi:hypothetical protein
VLIQTLKQASFPVILMGSDYWQGMLDWINSKMLLEAGYVSAEDLEIFRVIDDPKAAVQIIVDFQKSEQKGGIKEPPGIRADRQWYGI